METSQIEPMERQGIIQFVKKELGVDGESTGTEFSKAMGRLISKDLKDEDKEDCRVLLNGVENILEAQSRYSNISVEIIVTLSQITGHTPRKIISSISRNSAKLKVPAISWVNKNLRVADVVASHPKLSSISSIEKIDSIRRLDEDKIEKIAESGTLVDAAGVELEVNDTPTPQLRKAVNQLIKIEKEAEVEAAPEPIVEDSIEAEAPVTDTSEAPKQKVAELKHLSEDVIKVIPDDHPNHDVLLDILERMKADIELLNSHLDSNSGGADVGPAKGEADEAPVN